MKPHHFEELQRWLCQEALHLVGYPENSESAAYKAMTHEPEMLTHWWSGVFEKDEAETKLLDSAALAFARREPLPQLSFEQRARLALRLRLGSRILRALGSRNSMKPKKGWFPAKLYKLSETDLLEWLLVDGWPLCAEILDETLLWADEFEHPIAPSMKKSLLRQPSSEDSSSFTE